MAGGLSFCSFIQSFPPLFSLSVLSPPPRPSWPQAQNTQQTGFKGNLRLLLQTLEQPHLPFKILPAALSHHLHTERLLMLAASTAFHFTPSSRPGPWAREDALLILCLIVKKKIDRERSRCAYVHFSHADPCEENQRALLIITDAAELLNSTCHSSSVPSSANDCRVLLLHPSLPLCRAIETPSLTGTAALCCLSLFPKSEI